MGNLQIFDKPSYIRKESISFKKINGAGKNGLERNQLSG